MEHELGFADQWFQLKAHMKKKIWLPCFFVLVAQGATAQSVPSAGGQMQQIPVVPEMPDKELIDCLVHGLRVPEYMAERNYLVHNPQTSFEAACSLCRKTAIQDTIVAGVAGTLPPAAFYAGPPAVPSFLAKHKQHGSPAASPSSAAVPTDLADALTKLSDSIS
ncbi:hypothetical protein [Limnohabitans sp.]|uniref:hypothetical protein n=1 Tax=Limnohabitans sp. TaxID=1907725 RepID=UPI002AFEB28F|nr:hypothetical protein [Limnohabitans sp.]